MKRTLLLLAISLNRPAIAQNVVDVNNNHIVTTSMYNVVGGVPFINTKFTRLVDGSPFYNESWQTGKITMENGTVYGDVPVRLDLFNNELQYKDSNDQELIATGPVKELLFDNNTDRHLFVRMPYSLSDQAHQPHWYELVLEGKILLYKAYRKDLLESKPYGSATYEQQIKTTELYYLVANDRIAEVKKPKDFASEYPQFAKELIDYGNSLDGHMPAEQKMIQTARYLNERLK